MHIILRTASRSFVFRLFENIFANFFNAMLKSAFIQLHITMITALYDVFIVTMYNNKLNILSQLIKAID